MNKDTASRIEALEAKIVDLEALLQSAPSGDKAATGIMTLIASNNTLLARLLPLPAAGKSIIQFIHKIVQIKMVIDNVQMTVLVIYNTFS